jgi:hypothetical protein
MSIWFAFDETRPLAFFAGIWTLDLRPENRKQDLIAVQQIYHSSGNQGAE